MPRQKTTTYTLFSKIIKLTGDFRKSPVSDLWFAIGFYAKSIAIGFPLKPIANIDLKIDLGAQNRISKPIAENQSQIEIGTKPIAD